MILEEGVENVWARHALVGSMVRGGVEARGCASLPPSHTAATR